MSGLAIPVNELTIIRNEERMVVRACGRVTESEAATRRRRALKRVDSELNKGNFKAALSLVKQLQRNPGEGGLRGFGVAGAGKVRKNASSFDEVKLNVDRDSQLFQSIIDSVLHSVKSSIEFQLLENETEEVLVQNFGEVEDCGSSNSHFDYHLACTQHEAGHFLVGYIHGVLPRRYKVPSMEELSQDEFARGNVEFIGFKSLINVNVATMSKKKLTTVKPNNKTLKTYLCALLGGMVAEYLSIGYSDLLHSDVQMMDRVLKSFGFTENEIDFEVRHAAEDTVSILCSQREARCSLAKAMALGRSVGFCIDTIEETLVFENK